MADDSASQNPATDPPDKEKRDLTPNYLRAIERYEKGSTDWTDRCKKIVKVYLDEHRTAASPRRFAMLWSNIETLKPATYARLPQAVVSRRFKDADPAGRKAGEVLERCINTSFDLYGLDEVMRNVRDDRLLTARGQAWCRYEAEFGNGDQQPPTSEKVCLEFVHWSDFGHDLQRTWKDVTLAWRRVYMTKDKVEKRWDKDKADKLTYEVRQEQHQRPGASNESLEPQACIYEVWDKVERKTAWIAKEERLTLEIGDPPLSFRNFFPCPEPTYGTRATGSLIPTPDYRYYQDQCEEIDDLTQKIAALSEWLVLKAFIPAGASTEGADAILEMVREVTSKAQNKSIFVPLESFSGWMEKGGTKAIDWLPLDLVAQTIKVAIECRTQLINDVYQITGISDILRGDTDPNETLGAQELKAQTGSRRISTTQRDLARFARDLAELTGEVIAEVFQVTTIEEMSGMSLGGAEAKSEEIQMMEQQAQQLQMQMQQAQPMMSPNGQPPQQQQPNPQMQQQLQQLQAKVEEYKLNQEVLKILRDEKTRGFRIEIETDSTIEPDEQAEKQRRTEFLEAVGAFMERVMPALQLAPHLAPMFGEMLMFMVRGFRAGRQLEEVIERAVSQMTEQAQQPKPPDPKAQAVKDKAQIDQQAAQQKAQADQQRAQLDVQTAQQKHQMEIQKMQMEMRKMQAELEMTFQKAGIEQQKMQAEAAMDERAMDRQEQHDERSTELQGEAMERKHEITMEAAAAKGNGEGKSAPAKPKPSGGQNEELISELIKALKTAHGPKNIIRDERGRAVRVEPVTMN